jgi:peroxiredoxin
MGRVNSQRLTSVVLAIVFVLAVSTPGAPTASAPRKSPEFTISVPLGKTTLLSSYKGKVVVVEFLFIASEHCMHFAQVLNKLNRELGPRGFQPVGIVFDPPKVATSAEKVIPSLVDYFRLTYPVGFASKADVDTYLGRTGNELLVIPQVVVIDRAGVIRATTGDHTNPKLEDENSLRALIEGLLKEAASAKNSHTLETSLASATLPATTATYNR